jgi:hypothetical protein
LIKKSRVGYVGHMIHIWRREKNIYRIHIYREKSETRTEILVGITDEEDIFADVDILEFDMEKQLKMKHVRV